MPPDRGLVAAAPSGLTKGGPMAYKVKTIVRNMLDASGKSEQEVNDYLERDETYLSNVMSGKSRISPGSLAAIARACGFTLVATNGTETYEVDADLRHFGTVDFETTGEIHECEFNGKVICFTGKVYGLTRPAQEKLCVELGAKWRRKMAKSSGDVLVVGDLSKYGGNSSQIDDAKTWGREVISADDFLDRAEEIVGRRIVAR